MAVPHGKGNASFHKNADEKSRGRPPVSTILPNSCLGDGLVMEVLVMTSLDDEWDRGVQARKSFSSQGSFSHGFLFQK